MEMKPLNLVLFGAGVCTLLAFAMLPPAREHPSLPVRRTPNPLVAERNRLGAETRAAFESWRALSLRDSVQRVVINDQSSTRTPPRALFDERFPEQTRAMGERLAQRQWSAIGVDSAQVPVVTLVLRDSGAMEMGAFRERSMFVVPGAGDADNVPCVSVVMVRNQRERNTESLAKTLMYGLYDGTPGTGPSANGPCAFLAVFGRPGPQIARWLESRRYDLAMSSRWDAEPRVFGRDYLGSDRLINPLTQDSDIGAMSLRGRRCWLGDEDACEAVVLTSAPPSRFEAPLAPGVYVAGFGSSDDWREVLIAFLANMRRDIGEEKFAKFWTSQEEPPVAFRLATGESLGAWTHRWIKHAHGNTVAGAKVPAGHFVGGVVFALGCVSAAAVSARRRQVT